MMSQETLSTITAARVLALRKKHGWTQDELAEKANLERKSITRYENGQNIPGGKALHALARVFGVTADYLLGLTDHPYPIPAAESDLSPIELETVQALRRARNDAQRRRLLDALKLFLESETP